MWKKIGSFKEGCLKGNHGYWISLNHFKSSMSVKARQWNKLIHVLTVCERWNTSLLREKNKGEETSSPVTGVMSACYMLWKWSKKEIRVRSNAFVNALIEILSLLIVITAIIYSTLYINTIHSMASTTSLYPESEANFWFLDYAKSWN